MMRRVTWARCLCCFLLSCGGDGASSTDGGRDAPRLLSENTATLCRDGEDNDGDRFTDCADQDCWLLTFCADVRPDGWKPPPDGAPADSSHDAPFPVDGGSQLDSSRKPCAIHYDCAQGEFCYKGQCLRDSKQAVHHCGKPGCPPGERCLTQANTTQRCAEDPNHVCQDACDCGPAHCCLNNRCVRDLDDPWITGPVVGTSPPGKCERGTDATYCCAAPSCHAGKQHYGASAPSFRCQDGADVRGFCGGTRCFGTACRCEPGEACVDTVTAAAPAGRACGLLSGGSCVNNAIAEAVFGWSAVDLLPCCSTGCAASGLLCDAGWRSGGEWAYQRTLSVCGSCGNGVCEPPEETHETCAADCGGAGSLACGDGICAAEAGETPSTCLADCASPCTDAPVYPAGYRRCGDGVCGAPGAGPTTCDWDESETCRSCPLDCGPCEWEILRGESPALTVSLTSVWGSGPSDVFAVGGGTVLRYDGASFNTLATGASTATLLLGVWGSSASDVFVVGGTATTATILRHDGTRFTALSPGTTEMLHAVWGSGPSDIFAVGDSGTIVHHDGASWTAMPSTTTMILRGVWGSGPSDVFAVGGNAGSSTILHYDGAHWQTMVEDAVPPLRGVWGSGASDVFAVGGDATGGSLLRYDGASWTPVSPAGSLPSLRAVWGSGPGDVFAVGFQGAILRYDGTGWKAMLTSNNRELSGVWGSGPGDVFAVGGSLDAAAIQHYDGADWQPIVAETRETHMGVWGTAPGDLFVVGSGGMILHHDGSRWQRMSTPSGVNLRGVWGSAPDDAFAVGAQGTILRFDGLAWKGMASGTSAYLTAVWGNGPSDVFAVGAQGTILRYDGASWKPMDAGTTVYLDDVWGSGPSDVFVVGDAGTVQRYDGASWKPVNAGTNVHLYGVWGSGPGDLFVVGAQGTILRYDGASFSPMTSGTDRLLADVWGRGPSEVFAIGSDVILRYDGASWQESRVDLRMVGSSRCPGPGRIGPPDGYVVGSHGLVLRYCAQGQCP